MRSILYGKKLISLILMAVMVFNLAACGQAGDDRISGKLSDDDQSVSGEVDKETGEMPEAQAEDLMKGVESGSVVGKAVDDEFISAMTDFAVKLFQNRMLAEGEKEGENILISPLSVMLALAMTANGADGETRAQMEALLGGNISLEELNEYLYTYGKKLPEGEDYKLGIANSIWIRDIEELVVSKDFLQTNADYYNAAARREPFDEDTKNKINSWVKENTDGMIDSIVEEIPPETMMYLINALVFDAKWAEAYDLGAIREGSFTSVNGEERKVSMMSSEEMIYLDDRETVGFIKYYEDNAYSFVALLPNEGVDIDDYMASMTGERLQKTLNSGEKATVVAKIPKFSCEDETLLKEELKALGMPLAFDCENADFSGMAGDFGLYIGEVCHRTFISVDELGTKAGAVTSVVMDSEAAIEPEKIYYVTLDRPFVYMIVDNTTGIPVFIGAQMDIRE